jgi:hypothetical protein
MRWLVWLEILAYSAASDYLCVRSRSPQVDIGDIFF